jgi:2-methylcitrate dehydratase PrpD
MVARSCCPYINGRSRLNMMTVAAPSQELASFCARLRLEDMPGRVVERVKVIILDAVASALAGRGADEVDQLLSFARAVAPGAGSSIIGGGELSRGGATLVNSYLITAVTLCDVHRPSRCHVTPEVVAPALVAGEAEASSVRDLIPAVAAGLEVTTRIGLGLKPDTLRARGWHAPGITGPFGGAAAVGRLLGFDESQYLNAFGLAGSQATGSYAQLRTPAIKFQQSRGALAGLLAASLADTGFRAAQDMLLHPDGGLLHTHSDGGLPEAITNGLGDRWELENISLRPWPVAVHLQPLVTSLVETIVKAGLRPDEIAGIRVELSDLAYRMHGEVGWEDRFHARLSARYVTGIVVHDRQCWLDQFTSDRVNNQDVAAFIRNRVTVEPNAELRDGTVRLTAQMRDGSVLEDFRTIARGEPSDPLTRADVEQKFRLASSSLLSDDSVERVITLVNGQEETGTVRDLMQLLGGVA